MGLIVAFDEKYIAHGKLFWDDGESLGKLWFLPLFFGHIISQIKCILQFEDVHSTNSAGEKMILMG